MRNAAVIYGSGDVMRDLARSIKASRRMSIALVTSCTFLVLACWVVASPIGSSPDDTNHLTSIWCATGTTPGSCEIAEDGLTALVPGPLLASWCYAPLSDRSAACILDLPQHLQSPDWNGRSSYYPPIFYRIMHVFVTSNTTLSVIAMRALNGLLASLLVMLLLILAPASIRQAAGATAFFASVPLGLFIVSSNNPSSWAILGVLFYWAFLLTAIEAQRRRTLVASMCVAVLCAFIAIGARADAAAFIGFSTIASISLAVTNRDSVRSTILRWRFVPIVFVLIGAAIAFVSVRQSGVATGGFHGAVTVTDSGASGTVSNVAALSEKLSMNAVLTYMSSLPDFLSGAFGGWGLGWLDTPMPRVIVWIVFPIYLLLVFVGLGSMYRGKAVAVIFLSGAVVAIPTWIAVTGGSAAGTDLQPRYMYPLMLVLGGAALVHRYRTQRFSLSASQRWVLVVAIAAAQSLALHVNMRRYISGNDVSAINLNYMREWWWIPSVDPNVVWIIGSAAFLVLAFSVMEMFKTNRKLTHPTTGHRAISSEQWS